MKTSPTYPKPFVANVGKPSARRIGKAFGMAAEKVKRIEALVDDVLQGEQGKRIRRRIKEALKRGDNPIVINTGLVEESAPSTPALTPAEIEIIDLTCALITKFKDLPEHHPSDIEEMVFFIHRIQEKLMARAAIRACPQYGWTPLEPRRGGGHGGSSASV